MIVRSFSGAVVLLLATTCLSFAATVSMNQAAPVASVQPVEPPVPDTPVAGEDGYRNMVAYFQTCKKWGIETEVILQRLHTEAYQNGSPTKTNQDANFLKKLTERYPGATFNGKEGRVTIRKDIVAHFSDALKVDRISEVGGITVEYLLSQGLVHMTDGVNAATILIDQTNPGKSAFIDVNIAAIKAEAEKIVTDPDRKRIAAEPAEAAVMTDAYQIMGMVLKIRMDVFAGNMMRDPKLQRKALKIAADGYRERHSQDYQAADPSRKKKVVDLKPDKPADQRFYQGFLRIFAFILSAAIVLWLIFKGIHTLKTVSMDNSRKMRKGKYQTLSPMVKRILTKTGNSLWGRNIPWAKNFYIYERTDRWLLCDGKKERDAKISQARTRIEVCLRSTYFKIKLTRLNNAKSNIWVASHDFTKLELNRGLQEILQEMIHPTGRDDGADEETSVTPALSSDAHVELASESGTTKQDLSSGAVSEPLAEESLTASEPIAQQHPEQANREYAADVTPEIEDEQISTAIHEAAQSQVTIPAVAVHEQEIVAEFRPKRKRPQKKKKGSTPEVMSAVEDESTKHTISSTEPAFIHQAVIHGEVLQKLPQIPADDPPPLLPDTPTAFPEPSALQSKRENKPNQAGSVPNRSKKKRPQKK
jgi:hypothetical protein